MSNECSEEMLFCAIGDKARRRIIKLLLKKGEMETNQLVGELLKSDPLIAGVGWHLHILERSGIVERRFDPAAPIMFDKFYHVNKEKLKEALDLIENYVNELRKSFEEVEES